MKSRIIKSRRTLVKYVTTVPWLVLFSGCLLRRHVLFTVFLVGFIFGSILTIKFFQTSCCHSLLNIWRINSQQAHSISEIPPQFIILSTYLGDCHIWVSDHGLGNNPVTMVVKFPQNRRGQAVHAMYVNRNPSGIFYDDHQWQETKKENRTKKKKKKKKKKLH